MPNTTTITFTDDELDVLRQLLDFHADDEPDEYYPYDVYQSLRQKMMPE